MNEPFRLGLGEFWLGIVLALLFGLGIGALMAKAVTAWDVTDLQTTRCYAYCKGGGMDRGVVLGTKQKPECWCGADQDLKRVDTQLPVEPEDD